jgi:hypothetical protein
VGVVGAAQQESIGEKSGESAEWIVIVTCRGGACQPGRAEHEGHGNQPRTSHHKFLR